MPPTWVNPEWLDDDIVNLSKIDIDMWKTRVATTLGYRWRGFGAQERSSPFAKAVGGLEPISQDKADSAMKAYLDVLPHLRTHLNKMHGVLTCGPSPSCPQ